MDKMPEQVPQPQQENEKERRLSSLFEGVQSLIIQPLSEEEALDKFKSKSTLSSIDDRLRGNIPYITPREKELDVIVMNLNINHRNSYEDILTEMDDMGVRPLNYAELIQYGIEKSSTIRRTSASLVALGDTGIFDGELRAPSVEINSRSGISLSASPVSHFKIGGYLFLVARK